MFISYNTKDDGLRETISNALKEKAIIFGDFGEIEIDLESEASGYPGEVRVTIHPDLDEGFGSSWTGTNPTRFPARIRAAATAIKDHGYKGDYLIEHEEGILKIHKTSDQLDWDEDEVFASVEVYVRMHEMDINNQSFVKAEMNRDLRRGKLARRNRASIEFRMCNISYVFNEMGIQYVQGYLPAKNVGTKVREAIEEAIEKTGYLKGQVSTVTATGVKLNKLGRLPASELNKVGSDHIWNAVNKLLEGFTDHEFEASTDYDILTDTGELLAPKAVFRLAASEALGFKVQPKHFSGGLNTACFRILSESGFTIVPKRGDKAKVSIPPIPSEDKEWAEGNPKRVSHLKRERASGLSQAKKASFKRQHGKLFCEKCNLDPVEEFGGEFGEACIEVHHREISVEDMEADHKTRLEDLECLCANCHRVVHRLMKDK